MTSEDFRQHTKLTSKFVLHISNMLQDKVRDAQLVTNHKFPYCDCAASSGRGGSNRCSSSFCMIARPAT
jgi:hypothetical protein